MLKMLQKIGWIGTVVGGTGRHTLNPLLNPIGSAIDQIQSQKLESS